MLESTCSPRPNTRPTAISGEASPRRRAWRARVSSGAIVHEWVGNLCVDRLLAMVFLGLALSTCGGDDIVDDLARPDIAVVEQSVVRILGFGCGAPSVGTGFAVEPDLIVTSGHIVTGRDPETLAVVEPDGTEHSATLVGFDPDLDLAALRVAEELFVPVRLVDPIALDDAQPGATGVAVGVRSKSGEHYINEVDFEVDAPVNVNWDGVFRDTESRFAGVRVNAEIQRGDSGSPLFVNDTDVIGLIHSKNRSGLPRGYAVSATQVDSWLDSIDTDDEVTAERCA